jgi:ornithine cyclodeaminase/alanine dehydrogenase-like protein (mu-crystallin family)
LVEQLTLNQRVAGSSPAAPTTKSSPAQVDPGAPHYSTIQLLSDYGTGLPLALIDGTYTSTMLPACITALAATRLAHPRSRIVTFIGAGTQARVNLAALLESFPIEEVRIFTRTSRSANAFAEEIGSQGLEARVFEDPAKAVRDANIVVSTVPSAPDLHPFLSPDWVSAGAFVSAVDVGRSWMSGFEAFDRS